MLQEKESRPVWLLLKIGRVGKINSNKTLHLEHMQMPEGSLAKATSHNRA
jgi:hypothetical protein